MFFLQQKTVSQQVPGDGLDNDQDGLVDEEYCGFLWNGESSTLLRYEANAAYYLSVLIS